MPDASTPIYLSTIGVRFFYKVEATAGTKPTSGYTELKGIKSIPALNSAPDTLDTTTLNETEYKTSIPGLKDMGGSLSFTFNLSQYIKDAWDALMTAYEAGVSSTPAKATWFLIVIPGLTEGLYFPGQPSNMGLPELGVNSVAEIENYITPIGEPEFDTLPTDIASV